MNTNENTSPLEPASEPESSFLTALRLSKEALRIRVKNEGEKHSYVQLLDPDFQKEKITIDIPIMDDPTIGHLPKYRAFCNALKGKKISIGCTSLWSPSLTQHLDLFTLHVYDSTPAANNPHAFSNLVILPARVDPFQMRVDTIWSDQKFTLLESSRIAFLVPSYSTMMIDLYFDKIEPAVPDLPL